MIKFVAGLFADLFTFFCFASLALGAIAIVFALIQDYHVLQVLGVAALAFLAFIVFFGSLATMLDIRNCLRSLWELEKQMRSSQVHDNKISRHLEPPIRGK